MAISSTSFMAAPGGYGSILASKLDKIDCSQVLAAVLKADRALLGHIKMGAVAHNIQFDWLEDGLNEVVFTGYASVSTSVTVSGFTGSASLANTCRYLSLIAPRELKTGIASTGFILQVTSCVGADTLYTQLYGSITFSVATGSCQWIVISQPYGDSDDASTDISMSRSKKKNFTQIFERAIEISQSRKGMDMEAVTDELQYQIKNRTLEIKRELDTSVLLGRAAAYDATHMYGDLDIRTMQGIIEYIRDEDLDQTREDTNVTSLAGAALTIADVNALLYKIWDCGGLDETADPILVVGAAQQRVISSWERELRRVEQGEKQVGYYRDIFLSDMGVELPVVIDRWMPANTVLILDRSRVALRALQGDAWHMEKMAKTGRSEKWQLSGQYGLEIRNAGQCHGLLINCA